MTTMQLVRNPFFANKTKIGAIYKTTNLLLKVNSLRNRSGFKLISNNVLYNQSENQMYWTGTEQIMENMYIFGYFIYVHIVVIFHRQKKQIDDRQEIKFIGLQQIMVETFTTKGIGIVSIYNYIFYLIKTILCQIMQVTDFEIESSNLF